MQNISDDGVNVTFVSSPTMKEKRKSTPAVAASKSASKIPFASAGAAIPSDAITKDETVETDERSSNTSQANKTTSKATRSSKSFFKRKDKSAKQQQQQHQRNSNANTSTYESHGFISSFNQITSNNLPVITSATTTMLRNAVNGSGAGSTSIGNKKGERNSAMDTFTTEFIDDFTNDYAMEQILNRKTAKDECSKYSKTTQHSDSIPR